VLRHARHSHGGAQLLTSSSGVVLSCRKTVRLGGAVLARRPVRDVHKLYAMQARELPANADGLVVGMGDDERQPVGRDRLMRIGGERLQESLRRHRAKRGQPSPPTSS
jgi:hypothetical protein